DLDAGDAGLDDLVQLVGGELLVGLVEQLAGGEINDVGGGHGAIELAGLNLDLLDLVAAQALERVGRDLAGCGRELFTLDGDGVGGARTLKIGELAFGNDLPVQLAVLNVDGVDGLEG